MTLTINRVHTSEKGTYGTVSWNDLPPFCVSLEDPWENNERNISCVPHGRYECFWTNSPRFGRTIKVRDVKDRSHILFHRGNTTEDTQGCILLGQRFTRTGIGSSSAAFDDFIQAVPDDGFYLNIHWR